MAAATASAPKPEDRLAFADKLAQVRAFDTNGEYQKELDELEFEYQFILLRSLDLFHKQMQWGSLPERLHEIKEELTNTVGKFTYQTNLPTTNWNWNNIICKQCRKMSLKPIPATNELCCTRCGILETLDGAYFDYEELHKCGDYKIVKPRRTNRKYNFRTFIENYRKNITTKGHTLFFETIEKANEIFERIEQHLPNRISMSFVAYQIFGHVVQSAEEKYVLRYFWLRVPQNTVAKHIGKWNEMLQQLEAE